MKIEIYRLMASTLLWHGVSANKPKCYKQERFYTAELLCVGAEKFYTAELLCEEFFS